MKFRNHFVVLLFLLSSLTSKFLRAFEDGIVFDSSNPQHSEYLNNVVPLNAATPGLCTAVVISSDAVLLVRHCLRMQYEKKIFGISLRKTKRLDASENSIRVANADIPLAEIKIFSDIENDDRELVVAKLSKPVDIKKSFVFAQEGDIVQRVSFQNNSHKLITSGYGLLANNEYGKRGTLNFQFLKMGPDALMGAKPALLLMQPYYKSFEDETSFRGATGTLSGDSGSALFDADNGVLWGIGFKRVYNFSAVKINWTTQQKEQVLVPLIPYIYLPAYHGWLIEMLHKMNCTIPESLVTRTSGVLR